MVTSQDGAHGPSGLPWHFEFGRFGDFQAGVLVLQLYLELEEVGAAVEAEGEGTGGAGAIEVADVEVGDEEGFHIRGGDGLDAVAGELEVGGG